MQIRRNGGANSIIENSIDVAISVTVSMRCGFSDKTAILASVAGDAEDHPIENYAIDSECMAIFQQFQLTSTIGGRFEG